MGATHIRAPANELGGSSSGRPGRNLRQAPALKLRSILGRPANQHGKLGLQDLDPGLCGQPFLPGGLQQPSLTKNVRASDLPVAKRASSRLRTCRLISSCSVRIAS